MNVQGIWNALPSLLRRTVAYGIGAGVAMMLVVLAFAAVPVLRDWLRDKLEIPTKSELVGARMDDQALAEDAVRGAIEFAVRQRSEADSARYAAQFDEVSRTLIEPGIKRLRSVEEQVAHLNHLMGVQQDLVQDVSATSKEANSRLSLLQHQMNSPDETQQAILRQLKAMQAQMDSLRRPVRTNKQKF